MKTGLLLSRGINLFQMDNYTTESIQSAEVPLAVWTCDTWLEISSNMKRRLNAPLCQREAQPLMSRLQMAHMVSCCFTSLLLRKLRCDGYTVWCLIMRSRSSAGVLRLAFTAKTRQPLYRWRPTCACSPSRVEQVILLPHQAPGRLVYATPYQADDTV